MKMTSTSFDHNGRIPAKLALCDISAEPDAHVAFAGNRNPQIGWNDLPAGTKSLVLIVHDADVPSSGEDVNQEERSVPADLARVDFFHWVMVDINPALGAIGEGEYSDGVTPRGKDGPQDPYFESERRSSRLGLNDYTGWFEGDDEMAGRYFGYDGPGPPWNDSIEHNYHFTLYAIDVARLGIDGEFTGHQVRKAIEGHVLGQASMRGTYSLNPDVR